MVNDHDGSDEYGIDTVETSPYTIDRRSFMEITGGIGVGSLFETVGIVGAQTGGDTVIELEAVRREATGSPTDPDGDGLYEDFDGSGSTTYADVVSFFDHFDDDEVQSRAEDFDFNQNDRLDFDDIVTLFEDEISDGGSDDSNGTYAWLGVSPEEIADRLNPTLSLTAGQSYTVEWTNRTGESHDFVIVDAAGNELVSSSTVDEEGSTQSVEFQATEEMAEYYSSTYSDSQRGIIEISGGTSSPPVVSPNEIGIGASPSSDATVLWNGEEATLDQWHHRDGNSVEWTDEGEYFQVNGGTGDILSDAELGDCHLHLEWRAPENVSGEGQSRNNSGVKLMDRYEFQILDNYENPTYADGWAGAYYGQAPPLVSPLRPAGQWQAYDIIWHSPRFEDGELVRPAQATLLVNGVIVLAHLNIDGISGGTIEPYEPHPPEASVMLQDHQSDAPPQFRNIWYRPLEEDPVESGDTDLPEYDTTAGRGQPPAVTPTGPATEGNPPSDARVLLGDNGLDDWTSVGGGDPGWAVNQDYVEVVPGKGDIRTKESFGDSQVHLEWRVPEDVEGGGLDRGNSGLLMMGKYQIQILDNDGNPVDPVRWVGSYPDQAAPQVSPIRSQREWQTLDVVWQGPRFDGDTLEKPAQVTVLLNETVVQSRLVADGPNLEGTVGTYEPHPSDGPIRLEDGGDPIQFRNLWQRSLDSTIDVGRLSAPYGLNVGGVSSGRSDLSPGDTVEIGGVEYEPYTETIAPDPAVTLIGQHNESGANGDAKEIEGIDADKIYQTMMWSTDSFGYEILMEPGAYNVTFHVAELNFTPEAGPEQQRTFSAYVQGEPVFEGLETWDKPQQAISRTIEGIQIEDEPLVIELESSVENPMVNAIEIQDADDPYAGNPAVPPEEALDTFDLPDGWTIEQVAAEPMLDSPVDIKWDAKGRMWVVEMPDYMALVPGDGRGGDPPGNYGDWGNAEMSLEELTGWGDELTNAEPNGVIKMLADTDDDGVMDEVTTFADDLTLSRSLSLLGDEEAVMIAHSGSNFTAADLFTAIDQDGDLSADSAETVKSNWVSEDNPEHTSNGLNFNLNNWLYSANSGDRFRYRNGDIEEQNTHGRGQWGITQDDYGRLYTTTNPNWLYADLVPNNGDYLLRGSSDGSTGVMTNVAPDHTVYPIQEVWGTNRSYPGGPASHRDDGRLESVTAVSSPDIYRGDIFPEELSNDAFVPEPAAHVVAHFSIEDDESGLGLAVEHEVYDNEEWGQQDFLSSSDEVFRPINVKTGPDGALYIVDMYNGIFQHNRFLTDYLAEYFLQNNLHKVPAAGRIYRVYPEGAKLDDPPALDELPPEELAAQLESSNGWVRKTAQRLIVQEQMTDTVSSLREIAQESDDSLARMHALWALDGLHAIDADSVFSVMDDVEDSHVLAGAMQIGEALLETDDAGTYVDRLIDFADADQIRLVIQAAASLGGVADSDLQEEARPVLEDLLRNYESNDYVKEAVHSSPEMDISVDAEPVSAPFGFNAAGGEKDGTVTIDGIEFIEESLAVAVSGDAGASGSNEAVSPSTTNNSIAGTEHDLLYQSMQYGGNLSYEISIENGTYDVALYFIEYVWNQAGKRVFDVSVEGETVYSPLDIYAEAGSNTALTKTVENVEINDGTLTISSTTEVDNSSLCGFVIRSSNSNGGDVITPGATIELGGEVNGWTGRVPDLIEGESNPTLSLKAGESYTVAWENLDGAPHDLQILDSNGNELVGTETVSSEGEVASVEFTATEEMVEYYCSFHPDQMRGTVTL
ncbi:family 16 glycoside hydrolase [Haladaptatus sp. DYF46]|uniref:DUF7133 domain-containing protein n=1 Tax=Haladaptatus sp. DYF46 TaxID=2886041 RepID=UPI001E58FA86|nr:family 16 glycoside hydrolase [Haladaptatus sp. DYF46]